MLRNMKISDFVRTTLRRAVERELDPQ